MSSSPSSKDCNCLGVGSAIVSTAHAFRQALECELSRRGVTFRQWEVLTYLLSDGEQPQSDLSEKMGLEAQTMAGIIARMERDGWLTRKNCCEDRRRKLIRITQKAKTIWDELNACCEAVRQQAAAGLSSAQLVMLEQLCQIIRDNLCGPCHEQSATSSKYDLASESTTDTKEYDISLEDTAVDFGDSTTIIPPKRRD
ncbi:MAG: MarR family transcriptional regulator [Planctomycetaceae bacterium]|nr:MarR family transcriptional regulator [Planctomycetaceae bacterium]